MPPQSAHSGDDNKHDLIIGIDLGTTNSLVAICDATNAGSPRILADSQGNRLTPSVIRIVDGEAPIIGSAARDHAVEFPKQTIYSVKRLMGRGIADVQNDLANLTYDVVAGEHDTARIKIGDRIHSPQELSALILTKLKRQAETSLGREVRKAVITVPAYFDDAQRQATRDAGRIAGLDVVRIVNEPTAAALAYGIGTLNPKPETIAVYDLGGGTFDISILQVTPGDKAESTKPKAETASDGIEDGGGAGDSFFQVLATAGDTHLGGDDVDQLIINLVLDDLRTQFGAQLEFPPSTRQALRLFAEATKIRLSTEDTANLEIDLGTRGPEDGGQDARRGGGDNRTYRRTLTRAEFDQLIALWVERTLAACRRALRDADLQPSQIDRVVMVGGSTRIPLIRSAVRDLFECEPYTALDPDEVVALGAAVQASILAGANRDMLLLDVLPLSLGIETVGGAVAKLIVRNTTVPTAAKEMFSTSVDGQTNVKIHVLQGERELVRDCRSLAEFDLRGIPPMPAGIPQIEVEFLVDSNGILNVAAGERRSGKRASIQVIPRHGLTREEVDRMEAESYQHARQDMHAHRIIDLAANATLDIKWIREAMDRVQDDLNPTYRNELNAKISSLQTMIARAKTEPHAVNADEFHQEKESLDRMSVRLHEIAIARSLRD